MAPRQGTGTRELGDAVVAMIGDSTTNGHGAGDNPVANFTNAARRARLGRCAADVDGPARRRRSGVQQPSDGRAEQPIAIMPLYDRRLKIASSARNDWYATTLLSLGGCYFQNDAGSGSFALTPALPFDAIEIVTLHHGSGGTLRVPLDGAQIGGSTPRRHRPRSSARRLPPAARPPRSARSR